MDKTTDKDTLIETLLQERDELYQELSRLRQTDVGELDRYEALIREKDKKISHLDEKVKNFEDKLKQLTDQLSWYRRKFWKASSEKFIPQDPAQRKLDFDGLDVLPEEEETIKEAAKEIIHYERKKPERVKKQPVRMPLPAYLRREEEVIEPEGINENWVRIGEEVTEILEHKPGELYVRRIIRPKYALKKEFQKIQETIETEPQAKVIKVAQLPLLPLPRSNAGPSLQSTLW